MKTKRKEKNEYSFSERAKKDFRQNWSLYILVLPVLVYYTLFCYKPMYGALIAFKDYQPKLGIMGSPWVGMKYFHQFVTNPYFWRILKNTLVISISSLVFDFTAPIILALLINELRGKVFPRVVQTLTYLPHFISLVVVCGLIKEFTMQDGLINDLLAAFGVPRQTLLNNPNMFVPIYVISGVWQEIGWGSIIYLSALAGIDPTLYEAANVDGAGRWKQTLHVTIPGIIPTIIVMLILRVGQVMSVGYEKIMLLYNPAIYDTADVISTFVYRKGILERGYSYSAAVGLFNSVINCILLFAANTLSRKINHTSLW